MSLLIDTTLKLRGYIESKIGGRAENQDSAGSMDTAIGTVVVVCDGMGGMNGGQTASLLAVKTIIDDVSEAEKGDDPEDVLRNAFLHAQQVIIDAAARDPSLNGMGTTATAIIISKHAATVAHLGDSRIYQLRNRKKVFRTNDHSAVFQLVASGTLTEEQARLSAHSNIILKALGVDGDASPDVVTLPYLKGDRFVLCTDGFWGAFPESEFISLITRRGNLKNVLWATARTIDNAGKDAGGGHDNLTAAVIDVDSESILKTPMSKQMKLTLLCILAVLVGSICMNVVSAVRLKDTKKILTAVENAIKEPTKYKDKDALILSLTGILKPETSGESQNAGEQGHNTNDQSGENANKSGDK